MFGLFSFLIFSVITKFSRVNAVSFYVESEYLGVTCGAITDDDNVDPVTQSGYAFGQCLILYNENGTSTGSVLYSSTCSVNTNGYYLFSYNLYHDSQCKNLTSSGTEYKTATCYTNNDLTYHFQCADFDSPPYSSLSQGYVTGYVINTTKQLPIHYN